MTVRGSRQIPHLVIFQLLLLSVKGERRLIGSTKTVWGLVGHDIILPCGLESEEDITGQGVEWARSDLTPEYVFIYRDYKSHKDHLHPSFEGRTSVSLEGLNEGNISMKITHLRLNDSGTYACILPSIKKPLSAEVRLAVGVVSEPQIPHPVSLVHTLTIMCEAEDWYPEPEVEWRDSKGQTVFRDPNGTKKNENGYYDIHSKFIGDIRASEYYVCIIWQNETGHTSNTTYMVPADVVTLKDYFFWVFFLMVIGWLALVIVLATITFGYYTGRLQCQNSAKSDADGKMELEDNPQEQIRRPKQQNEELTKKNEEIEGSKTTKNLQSSPSLSSVDSKVILLSQDRGSSTSSNQGGEEEGERKPQEEEDLRGSRPTKDATWCNMKE